MYKDIEKQREANRVHAKAYRRRKGMTVGYDAGMTKVARGMTKTEGMTQGMTGPIIKTRLDAVKAVEKIGEKWPNGRCKVCGNFECSCSI